VQGRGHDYNANVAVCKEDLFEEGQRNVRVEIALQRGEEGSDEWKVVRFRQWKTLRPAFLTS